MEDSARATIVAEVARDVLSEVAPQEMPIFAAASRAYFADPDAALRQLRSKDNVLGFGVEALTVLLTPVVLQILSEVFEFLMGAAEKAFKDGVTNELSEVVKAMFKKFHPTDSNIPSILTKEQIGLIHGNVLLAADKLRLPADEAQSLANAITAQLVLPKD
jgi:hypothetical protein